MISPRETRTNWTPIVACALCFAVGGNPISFTTASLFALPITRELHWTRTAFFAGLSVATIVSAVILPAIGQAVDRWGTRWVVLPGIAAFSAVVASLSRLNGWWPEYLALMAVLGVVTMMHGPLPYSRVVVDAAGPRRGLALGLAISGSTLGTVLLPPLCSTLIAHSGWRVTELVLAGLVLVVALPPALLVIGRRPRGAQAGPVKAKAPPPPMPWAELRSPIFWTLALSFLLNAVAVNAFMGHVAAIAAERGLPMTIGAMAISASGLGSAVARLASGPLLDRIRTPQIGQLWFVLAFLGLLTAASAASAPAMILAAVLIGATLGAEVQLIAYFTSRFYPPGLYGRMYGILFPFFMAGVSLGPLAFAVLFDAVHTYRSGLVVMAVAQLLGCLLLSRVGPYRYQVNGELGPSETTKGAPMAAAPIPVPE